MSDRWLPVIGEPEPRELVHYKINDGEGYVEHLEV